MRQSSPFWSVSITTPTRSRRLETNSHTYDKALRRVFLHTLPGLSGFFTRLERRIHGPMTSRSPLSQTAFDPPSRPWSSNSSLFPPSTTAMSNWSSNLTAVLDLLLLGPHRPPHQPPFMTRCRLAPSRLGLSTLIRTTSALLQHLLSFVRSVANKASVYAVDPTTIGFTVALCSHILARLPLRPLLPPPASTKSDASTVFQLASLHLISRQTLMTKITRLKRRSLIDLVLIAWGPGTIQRHQKPLY